MQITELVYIDANGYHYGDYPEFLTWLQDEYRVIYGADVYLEADSQDGAFLAILAQAFYDIAALGAAVYNSFSPSGAQGVGLSRVVKINGIQRRNATFSEATLTIVGTAGTVLNGAIAQDTLGQLWLIPDGTTIPFSGTVNVVATAQERGAVSAQANSINKIYTPTLGWQTVNNSTAAIEGAPIETDAQLRARQAISTSNPSITVFEGTVGAVGNVDGVTLVKGYENDTDITDSNGIPPHSIEIFALGGDDVEIAETIAAHKTPGTGTYGTTTETVYDSKGMPSDISFSRPIQATIGVEITIASGPGWSSDYEQQIKDRVATVVNAFGVGALVLLTRLFAPAYLEDEPGETYDIVSIEIEKNGGGLAPTNIALDYDEYAFCDADVDVNIVVT